MHFSWAWLANLHSKANSPFRSKPAEMSAIRATRAEYKPAAFLYSVISRSFSSQQRSFMLLRPLREMWPHRIPNAGLMSIWRALFEAPPLQLPSQPDSEEQMGQGKGLRGHDVTTSSQRLSKKKKRGSDGSRALTTKGKESNSSLDLGRGRFHRTTQIKTSWQTSTRFLLKFALQCEVT